MLYPDDLSSLVQGMVGFGVTQMDLTTMTATWSDETFRIYGWEPGEVTPSLEMLLTRVYPADVERVRRELKRAARVQPSRPIELRVVRPDGSLRTLQIRIRLVLDDAGKPVRFVGCTSDITDHKDATARLVFADRMAAVGTLAGGAAHEINNPLAFISAHLELIEGELGAAMPADVAASLGEIRYGLERIRTLVRGLQAFSRPDDEGAHASVDVRRVLELAVTLAGNALRHRAQIVRELEPLPEVMANEATLAQVFVNLLINAAEAIPEGHADAHRIRISTRTDKAGWALVEISDTGRGIARDIAGQIFDPFFTTKPVGAGTGLGLSICHGVVSSLGGEISFTTEVGVGTTFRVALPPAAVVAKPAAPPAPIVVPAAAPRAHTRVLIIDDEPVFASALRRLIARDGHRITIATDAREAVARAEAGERFDAILCDLMMPNMSGMEVHAQLTALAPEQAARMIFVTGGAFSPHAKAFLDQLVNPWFDKPCDLEQLRAAILRVAQS